MRTQETRAWYLLNMAEKFHIGTAHWQIPKQYSHGFSAEGSHLQRYASRLNTVEINSSFYKEHQAKTYERWRDSVPADFRFSVKISKVFTHDQELRISWEALKESIEKILRLQPKLGVLLVQLPPSLDFQIWNVTDFFNKLRQLYRGPIAIEPRHYSWLQPAAIELMQDLELSKVYADPAPCPLAIEDSPQAGVTYLRLHGSPLIYKSNYSLTRLQDLAKELQALRQKNVWCIFDNTTYGYATKNALELSDALNLKSAKSISGDRWAWLDDPSNPPPGNDPGLPSTREPSMR